jgi:hypothetical protein
VPLPLNLKGPNCDGYPEPRACQLQRLVLRQVGADGTLRLGSRSLTIPLLEAAQYGVGPRRKPLMERSSRRIGRRKGDGELLLRYLQVAKQRRHARVGRAERCPQRAVVHNALKAGVKSGKRCGVDGEETPRLSVDWRRLRSGLTRLGVRPGRAGQAQDDERRNT